MVVINILGAREFLSAGFRFRSSLYQESRENELMLSCLYILFFLPLIFILAFIKEQMVSYELFFFIFLEEETGGSSEQTPDNFSVSYPEVFETSPKALRKKESKCSRENSVW